MGGAGSPVIRGKTLGAELQFRLVAAGMGLGLVPHSLLRRRSTHSLYLYLIPRYT